MASVLCSSATSTSLRRRWDLAPSRSLWPSHPHGELWPRRNHPWRWYSPHGHCDTAPQGAAFGLRSGPRRWGAHAGSHETGVRTVRRNCHLGVRGRAYAVRLKVHENSASCDPDSPSARRIRGLLDDDDRFTPGLHLVSLEARHTRQGYAEVALTHLHPADGLVWR